jgi:hypothetical protein
MLANPSSKLLLACRETPPPTVGRVVFYAARVISKESRRLVLPRTYCYGETNAAPTPLVVKETPFPNI